MIRDDDARADLAARLSDGRSIDWDALQADDGLVRRLRAIEGIQDAYRRSAHDHDRPGVLRPEHGPAAEPAFRWGDLDVYEAIGRGSSAVVHRAVDRKLDREVALKLFDGSRAGDEALEEARRLARVRHPNLLTVHGADTIDGRTGVWTESIVGMDLDEELRRRGRWTPDEAIRAGATLCDALQALHEHDLAHGDLTPRNVLRERGGRLVLVDLGASTDAASASGTIGVLRTGTPLATPPECLEGKAHAPADDLYALGVLLYRMLADAAPIEAESIEQLRRAHRETGPRPLRSVRPDVSARLATLIDAAIARDPAHRFADAGTMRAALAAARPPRRRPAAVLSLAVVLVLVGVTIARGPWFTTPAVPDAPTTTLLASRGDVYGPVADAASVAVGERLHVDLDLSRARHVYVLNEDASGAVHVLFPLPGLDLSNPLGPGSARLPGTLSGREFGWQVSSAAGEEKILVVRADAPLPVLEDAMASLPGASRDRAVERPRRLDTAQLGALRGVAGMAPSEPPAAAGAFLESLVEEHALGDRDDVVFDLLRFVSVR